MATDESDASKSGGPGDTDGSGGSPTGSASSGTGNVARVGEYTWADFMEEHGHGGEVDSLYANVGGGLLGRGGSSVPSGDDWSNVSFDPSAYLGFHPDELGDVIRTDPTTTVVNTIYRQFAELEHTPIARGWYTWEHFKQEYYYDDEGEPPVDKNGEQEPFDGGEYLGFNPDFTENVLSYVGNIGSELADVVDDRTVTTIDRFDEAALDAMPDITEEDVENFDEDDFFSDEHGNTTVVNRYDLEKAVPEEKKSHFLEEARYWVNKPYSFVIIFHSVKENEKKYYAIEPSYNEIEADLMEFMKGKLRNTIKYSDDDVVVEGKEENRAAIIERETRRLLRRYGLYSGRSDDESESSGGFLSGFGLFGDDEEEEELTESEPSQLEGIEVRPEPVILEENPQQISEYQVEKLLYYLKRNFIGFERIDPIKHDTVNVEDISCDGYNSPVFVYHSDHEQIITNIYHGKDELDDFVVKMAQRSGKGISKRRPQVDATLTDGSRAQLTLGGEVSDHGTNYTIRQFQEVPFTPIDQICWNTLSLDEVAFLWLAIENHKSMIIAGGTATGKTTLLNALSLFIPSSAKIVSIEDTREVELPQRNWIASVTRPSFGEDDSGDVDEFDLLEAALRQRPDYIVMGEVRGEEGRDLFQVMSTGHTSYATFHADSVGEVLKRFTTDPINVSKTMFTALDLVAIQSRTRVGGNSVVRNNTLTEINHYDAENDEINVQDVYQWQAETDEFLKMGDSNTLEEIMFDRGWSYDRLQDALFKREVILAYLIKNGLNTYTQVAATIQAFINDPETILTLVANDQLEYSLEALREMESVLITVDPAKEEMAPRPGPDDTTERLCLDILDRAEDSLFEDFKGKKATGLASALEDAEPEEPKRAELKPPEDDEEIEFSGELKEEAFDHDELEVDTETDAPVAIAEGDAEAPALEGASGGDPTAPAEASNDPNAPHDDVAATGDGSPGGQGAVASDSTAGGADFGGTTSQHESGDDRPDWLFGDDEADLFGDDREDEEPDVSVSFESPDETGDDQSGGLAFGSAEEPTESSEATAFSAENEAVSSSDSGAFGSPQESDDPSQSPVFGESFEPETVTPDDDSTNRPSGGAGGGLAFGVGGSTEETGGNQDSVGADDSTEEEANTFAFGNDGEDDTGELAFGSDDDDTGGLAFGDDDDDDDDTGGLAFGDEPIEDGGTLISTEDDSAGGAFADFEGVDFEEDDEKNTEDGTGGA